MCGSNKDDGIKPVSCRVASFLDNKTDRIIYEEAVCEINRVRTQSVNEKKDISLLEESVLRLEEAVKKAPPSSRYFAEKEMDQVWAALEKIQGNGGISCG